MEEVPTECRGTAVLFTKRSALIRSLPFVVRGKNVYSYFHNAFAISDTYRSGARVRSAERNTLEIVSAFGRCNTTSTAALASSTVITDHGPLELWYPRTETQGCLRAWFFLSGSEPPGVRRLVIPSAPAPFEEGPPFPVRYFGVLLSLFAAWRQDKPGREGGGSDYT